MTQMRRITADKPKKISVNPLDPRHPRSINPSIDVKSDIKMGGTEKQSRPYPKPNVYSAELVAVKAAVQKIRRHITVGVDGDMHGRMNHQIVALPLSDDPEVIHEGLL